MIGSCLRHRGTAIRALASAPHRLRLQRTHGRVSVSVSPARPDDKDDPKRRSVFSRKQLPSLERTLNQHACRIITADSVGRHCGGNVTESKPLTMMIIDSVHGTGRVDVWAVGTHGRVRSGNAPIATSQNAAHVRSLPPLSLEPADLVQAAAPARAVCLVHRLQ